MQLTRARLMLLLCLTTMLLVARTTHAAARPSPTPTPATLQAPLPSFAAQHVAQSFLADDDPSDLDDALSDGDYDLDDDCLPALAQALEPPRFDAPLTIVHQLPPPARTPRTLFRPPRFASV